MFINSIFNLFSKEFFRQFHINISLFKKDNFRDIFMFIKHTYKRSLIPFKMFITSSFIQNLHQVFANSSFTPIIPKETVTKFSSSSLHYLCNCHLIMHINFHRFIQNFIKLIIHHPYNSSIHFIGLY